MQLSDVEALVAHGADSEWKSVEGKKSLAERDAAMRTLCGFLNGEGGSVLFGVTPQGRIVGTELTDESTRSVPDLFRFFEPAVHIRQERVPLDNGKWVYVLSVEPGMPEQGPFQYQGRAYVRNGSRTDQMPQSVFEARLMRRGSALHRWEVQPAPSEITVSSLDLDEIRRTVSLGVAAGRIPPEDQMDSVEVMLRNFHVLREDGRLLNAALALFGPADPIRFPQCTLRLAHFAGVDKDSDFLDVPEPVTGNAFKLLAAAEEFLRRRLPLAGRVVPGLFERVDEPVFPVKVLREALANAFAHRDYSQAGGAVSVAIFANHVEITNPGSLPEGWDLDALLTPHQSQARNPVIAQVFYKRKLIDEWGRGTRLIYQLCQEAQHPAPAFFTGPGSFGVRLNSAIPLSPSSRGVKVEELTDSDIAILQALRAGPQALSAIVASVGARATPRKVRAALPQLEKRGMTMAPARRGRGAQWSITAAGMAILKRAEKTG